LFSCKKKSCFTVFCGGHASYVFHSFLPESKTSFR
jgi:hypothetical protein